MFLVLTCSPRRVEHFSCLSRRNPTVRFPLIREESKEKKKIYFSPSQFLVLHAPALSVRFLLHAFVILFFSLSGTHMSLFLPFLVCFSPKTIYFVSVSVSFILIEYSLNIYHFLEFFKNPVFRFNSTFVA